MGLVCEVEELIGQGFRPRGIRIVLVYVRFAIRLL